MIPLWVTIHTYTCEF